MKRNFKKEYPDANATPQPYTDEQKEMAHRMRLAGCSLPEIATATGIKQSSLATIICRYRGRERAPCNAESFEVLTSRVME